MCLLVQVFHFAYRWVRFTVPDYAGDFSAIPNGNITGVRAQTTIGTRLAPLSPSFCFLRKKSSPAEKKTKYYASEWKTNDGRSKPMNEA